MDRYPREPELPKPIRDFYIHAPRPSAEFVDKIIWLDNHRILYSIASWSTIFDIGLEKEILFGRIQSHLIDGGKDRVVIGSRKLTEKEVIYFDDREVIIHEWDLKSYNLKEVSLENDSALDFEKQNPESLSICEGDQIFISVKPDGSEVSISLDNHIEIRGCVTLDLLQDIELRYWIYEAKYSPTGAYLVVTYANNDVEILDTESWESFIEFSSGGDFVFYSSDQKLLMMTHSASILPRREAITLTEYDFETDEKELKSIEIANNREFVGVLACSPNSYCLAATIHKVSISEIDNGHQIQNVGGQLRIWKLPECLQIYNYPENVQITSVHDSKSPLELAFSPDSSRLAVIFTDGLIRVWKIPELEMYPSHTIEPPKPIDTLSINEEVLKQFRKLDILKLDLSQMLSILDEVLVGTISEKQLELTSDVKKIQELVTSLIRSKIEHKLSTEEKNEIVRIVKDGRPDSLILIVESILKSLG